MTYVKLDDKFMDHPKVVAAGPLAAFVFIAALCYSSRHLTDGAIHDNAVGLLSPVGNPRKKLESLALVGLVDKTPTGWQIRDYSDWQRTRDQVESIKQSRAEAGKRGGSTAKQTPSKEASKSEANEEAKGTPESRVQSPESRTTTNSVVSPSVTRQTDDEDSRIGEALALLAKAKAKGEIKPPTWHETVIANLRAEQGLHIKAAQILVKFDPPADVLAGALAGDDARSLGNYKHPCLDCGGAGVIEVDDGAVQCQCSRPTLRVV